MGRILLLFNDRDVCALPLLVVILLLLGRRMIRDEPGLETWGKRLATAAFVAFLLVEAGTTSRLTATVLLGFTLRGLLVAGLLMGVSWIALAIAVFVWRVVIGVPLAKIRTWLNGWRQWRKGRAEGRRRKEEQRRWQEEYDRAAPDREKAKRMAEAQANDRAVAQQRRAAARLRCENFYTLHGPELRARFSPAQFADYGQRHLGDDHAPEVVEHRAVELLTLMQEHLTIVGAPTRKKSLADIAAWFLEEKTKIDALPLNVEDKEQMIADLEARFTQLQQKYIRSMNP